MKETRVVVTVRNGRPDRVALVEASDEEFAELHRELRKQGVDFEIRSSWTGSCTISGAPEALASRIAGLVREEAPLATETIFMSIVGPKDATTDQLVAKAAEMLEVGKDDIEVVDEVRPGEICFNAEMPEGYYDEHEDGGRLWDEKYELTWEKP